MQRILDPARIEAFAHRSIPRLRLPDRTSVFLERAQRLRALAQQGRDMTRGPGRRRCTLRHGVPAGLLDLPGRRPQR